MVKKIIPSYYYKSIYDIPYTKLYEEGFRLILTDLDNTLISYKEEKPSIELETWLKNITDLGFRLVIVSNSRKTRVSNFAKDLNVDFVKFSTKPLKRGFKKALKKNKDIDKSKVVFLGDQLMTDILGANRMGFCSILIKAIDRKTEHFYTKINRQLEKFFLKRAKKKYKKEYELNLKEYEEENYDNKKM